MVSVDQFEEGVDFLLRIGLNYFYLLICFWPYLTAGYGSLVVTPRIEPMSLQSKHGVLTIRSPGEFLD